MSTSSRERHLVTKPGFWRASGIYAVLFLIFFGQLSCKGADSLEQWQTRYYDTNTFFSGSVYANGRFVLAGSGQDGGIFTSADGLTWNPASTNIPNQLTSVTYGNGVYVAVGIDLGDITFGSFAGYTTSTNGSDWSRWARF